jgi:hypothetical protein
MLVLEQKLSILALGPSQTRRNPALDVLTGRVPDERLVLLKASLMARSEATPGSTDAPSSPAKPTAMDLPVAAIRMAAIARSNKPGLSPFLQPSAGKRMRLRLVSPPPSRLARVPWLGPLLIWLRAEYRPYRRTVHNHRARPAS